MRCMYNSLSRARSLVDLPLCFFFFLFIFYFLFFALSRRSPLFISCSRSRTPSSGCVRALSLSVKYVGENTLIRGGVNPEHSMRALLSSSCRQHKREHINKMRCKRALFLCQVFVVSIRAEEWQGFVCMWERTHY